MRSGLRWLWVSVLVFIVDFATKSWALANLVDYQPMPITSFFNLTLSYNTGAAFSFLHTASGWQKWLFGSLALTVSVILIVWLKRISYQQCWLAISLALIIGGALGNLCDRLIYGHVIDFIDLYVSHWHWPVFNMADSAVCLGAAMLFWDTLKNKK